MCKFLFNGLGVGLCIWFAVGDLCGIVGCLGCCLAGVCLCLVFVLLAWLNSVFRTKLFGCG